MTHFLRSHPGAMINALLLGISSPAEPVLRVGTGSKLSQTLFDEPNVCASIPGLSHSKRHFEAPVWINPGILTGALIFSNSLSKLSCPWPQRQAAHPG